MPQVKKPRICWPKQPYVYGVRTACPSCGGFKYDRSKTETETAFDDHAVLKKVQCRECGQPYNLVLLPETGN